VVAPPASATAAATRIEEIRAELVALAQAMIRGEFGLIEGVRRICRLRILIEDSDNEVFLPIRAVDSETDAFPTGTVRDFYIPERLRALDEEMNKYLSDAAPDILKACRRIVSTYSNSHGTV
jgi:hypothetical protein